MSTSQDNTQFGTLIQMEGTLAERPAVRTLPVGESGEPMPVLRLKLIDVGPARRTITCDQNFPMGAHAAAQARALQLKKGMRLTVQVAVDLVECHFPVTAHITTTNLQPQPNKEACHA